MNRPARCAQADSFLLDRFGHRADNDFVFRVGKFDGREGRGLAHGNGRDASDGCLMECRIVRRGRRCVRGKCGLLQPIFEGDTAAEWPCDCCVDGETDIEVARHRARWAGVISLWRFRCDGEFIATFQDGILAFGDNDRRLGKHFFA